MSDVEIAQTASGEQLPTESATPEPATLQQRAADNRHGTRIKVSVHRLDGGLEGGESDARVLTSEGFPIFTPPDSDRARWIPARDIKYVVLGSVDDSNLEPDPGDKSSARKAILRFRDGEWIAAYMDPGQASDGAGVAIQIRLTERQRIIPAVAASAALLEMQFVDAWTSTPDAARPLRRRSDIMEAAARQGRDRTASPTIFATASRSSATSASQRGTHSLFLARCAPTSTASWPRTASSSALPKRRRSPTSSSGRRLATDRWTACFTTARSARSWSTAPMRCSSSVAASSPRLTFDSRTRTSCSRRSGAWSPPPAGISMA